MFVCVTHGCPKRKPVALPGKCYTCGVMMSEAPPPVFVSYVADTSFYELPVQAWIKPPEDK